MDIQHFYPTVSDRETTLWIKSVCENVYSLEREGIQPTKKKGKSGYWMGFSVKQKKKLNNESFWFECN